MKVKHKTSSVSGEGIIETVRQLKKLRNQREMFEDRERVLRDRLMIFLAADGIEDEKGSQWYELPEEIEGVSKLQRQKRTTTTLKVDAAERRLKKLGLWEECSKTVTVIDEDAVLAASFEKRIPEKDMKTMYEESVNYALYLR